MSITANCRFPVNNSLTLKPSKDHSQASEFKNSRSLRKIAVSRRQDVSILDYHLNQWNISRHSFICHDRPTSNLLSAERFTFFSFFAILFLLFFIYPQSSFVSAQDETIQLSVNAVPGPPVSKSKSIRLVLKPEKENSQPEEITGQLWADYRSEGKGLVALEDPMGRIHVIQEKNVSEIVPLDLPFEPYNKKRIADELQKEFGKDFQTYSTSHFIIIHHTSSSYAAWCGKLFESLYSGFEKYQSRKGFNLRHTEVPMIAVVFGSKSEFEKYAEKDAPGVKNIVAYYHRMNNRIVLYDLSGFESSAMAKKRSLRSIDAILSRPQAAFTVATIIHEATHQISFNRKIFLRSGPFPLWFSEGLSMYFETPDVDSRRGWSPHGIDRPNSYRLKTFNKYILSKKPDKPFQNVIQQEVFTDDVNNSYATAWALFYYLNEKEPKNLAKYQDYLRNKIPFIVYSPEERLADFEKFFGKNWNQFYKDFSQFFQNLN